MDQEDNNDIVAKDNSNIENQRLSEWTCNFSVHALSRGTQDDYFAWLVLRRGKLTSSWHLDSLCLFDHDTFLYALESRVNSEASTF